MWTLARGYWTPIKGSRCSGVLHCNAFTVLVTTKFTILVTHLTHLKGKSWMPKSELSKNHLLSGPNSPQQHSSKHIPLLNVNISLSYKREVCKVSCSLFLSHVLLHSELPGFPTLFRVSINHFLPRSKWDLAERPTCSLTGYFDGLNCAFGSSVKQPRRSCGHFTHPLRHPNPRAVVWVFISFSAFQFLVIIAPI